MASSRAQHWISGEFSAHEADIAANLATLEGSSPDGKDDTTGHSLGGALAQLAASPGGAEDDRAE